MNEAGSPTHVFPKRTIEFPTVPDQAVAHSQRAHTKFNEPFLLPICFVCDPHFRSLPPPAASSRSILTSIRSIWSPFCSPHPPPHASLMPISTFTASNERPSSGGPGDSLE